MAVKSVFALVVIYFRKGFLPYVNFLTAVFVIAADTSKPLTFAEGFWLATRSGGAFFGKVGAFEDGFEADIVVLDDAKLPHPQALTIEERLERSVYLGADREAIAAKFVAGERIL